VRTVPFVVERGVTTMTSPKNHLVRILDSTGDTRLSYDPADPEAVRSVERRFNELMERNFVAFDVSTQPGKIVTTFDPAATEIVISHQFAGG
jgi:hypothetical protein